MSEARVIDLRPSVAQQVRDEAREMQTLAARYRRKATALETRGEFRAAAGARALAARAGTEAQILDCLALEIEGGEAPDPRAWRLVAAFKGDGETVASPRRTAGGRS